MKLPAWSIVAAAVFVLLIVVVACALTTRLTKNGPPSKQSRTSLTESAAFTGSETNYENKFYWDFRMYEGIPFIKVRLASQPEEVINCVLDSGSGFLNIASECCDFCDDDHGTYKSCAHNAVFAEVIEYGTQSDTVVVRRDQLLIKPDASRQKTGISAIDVEIHVTVDRTRDSSNFNIFGVSNTGFLKNLLRQDRALMISFKPGNRGGFVTSVSQTEARAYRSCAITNAPLVALWSMPFYIVKLAAIKIGGIVVPTPRYAILDTGSNVISVPPPCYDALVPHVKPENSVEIVFGEPGTDYSSSMDSSDDPVGGRLTVPYKNYTYWSQLLIDDDVPIATSAGPLAIIGCNAMLGYTFIFEKQYVSIVKTTQNMCTDVVHPV
jgi:hypothetical protein